MIQFNYGMTRWNLHPPQTGRISFFWKGILSCLLALRGCLLKEPFNGLETLFWKDCWINGRAPMYVWPVEYRDCLRPNGTVKDLIHLCDEIPLMETQEMRHLRDQVRMGVHPHQTRDKIWWKLSGNGTFTVKSFNCFSNHKLISSLFII